MNKLTLGSLFDGIGCWQVSAVNNGIIPTWSSEIDDYPASVSQHHFPNTIQLGDVNKIDGAKIPPVDIICAGSPCQDLSVAGKRAGLEGERSGLFIRAIDIVRQMRAATNGEYPRFFCWENVMGAFSSNKGVDFKTVLEEITETEIPVPQGGKWAESGMVECPGVRVEWTSLDASRMGVPQRRKRIFLVADFNPTDQSRGTLLPVEESLSRDTEASQGTGQGPSTNTEASVGETSWSCIGVDLYNQNLTGNIANTVTSATGGTNTSDPKVLQKATDMGGWNPPGGQKVTR